MFIDDFTGDTDALSLQHFFTVFCVGEIKEKTVLSVFSVLCYMENTVQWLANTAQWAVQRCQEYN